MVADDYTVSFRFAVAYKPWTTNKWSRISGLRVARTYSTFDESILMHCMYMSLSMANEYASKCYERLQELVAGLGCKQQALGC